MIPIPFISSIDIQPLRLGYDNSDPVPSDSRYYVFFRTELTTVSATRVGIRIPVSMADSYPAFTYYNIGSTSVIDFTINTNTTDDPLFTSGVSPWPTGNERLNWVSAMEGDSIVIYTTNSTSKAMLSTGVKYWFKFQLKGTPSGFFWGKITPTNPEVDKSVCNFRSSRYLQLNTFSNGSWIVPVKDYND
jgi:hypothetical protein